MSTSAPAILVRDLRKAYGEHEAVRGLDFEVAAGEVFGLLGPNGAGKTTTVEILEGYRSRTAGIVSVLGHDPEQRLRALRERVGIVLQSTGMYRHVTPREALGHFAHFYPRPRDVEEVIAITGLQEKADAYARTLSGGQRRRLDIAMGLVHSPRLIFLDEPTSGLDPQARANLWQHVRGLRDDRGATVFLTTHYLEEADALCDRILVIDHGQIVAAGGPEELKRRISGDTVDLTFPDDGAAVAAAALLDGQIDGPLVRLQLPSAVDGLPVVFRALDEARISPLGVAVHRPTLDDVFLSLTGHALRDEGVPA